MEVNRKRRIRFTTMQILVIGFFAVIMIGGFLLWLPISNQKPIAFVDALFTSVTAVCVTGLVTIVPATQFTIFGKVILMLLIQVGGLGIIACATAFLLILRRRISVRERMMIQEAYSMDSLSGMVAMIIWVIKGTFLVEGIGALFYMIQFIPEFGVVTGFCYGIFHSISAFCNAGIDIIGDSSFQQYAGNPLISIVTMFLIMLGGLGFPVWQDVVYGLKKFFRRQETPRAILRKMHLHSKVVLLMTFIMIVGGALGVLLLDYSNPETLGGRPFGEKVLASFFQSVTTRTAGFATISQNGISEAGKFWSCLLMFVGGSPGGTAGGVKTTTIALLFLNCLAVIRGGQDGECFGRRVRIENIRLASVLATVFLGILVLGTLLVSVLEPEVSFSRVLYETTSAICTVGLSADLTPSLGTPAKIVLMLMMYIGRVGPLTMAFAFAARKNPKDNIRQLPSRGILIG